MSSRLCPAIAQALTRASEMLDTAHSSAVRYGLDSALDPTAQPPNERDAEWAYSLIDGVIVAADSLRSAAS
jgi:hypothetical protein